jgi:hypothetical protein
MILHVTEARYLDGYRIEVSFNDGRKGTVDLSGALGGPVFQPLKDIAVFAQLKLDKELDTVSWPNGADMAPEYLYFRAFKDEPGLQDQFKTWGYVA